MAQAPDKQPDTMGSAAAVRGQTKLMNSAGSAWHAVKVGNLEKITNLFPALGDVYAQGPVGENVFHIAMLLNTPTSLAIARYLIRVYGRQLVNTPYQERKKASDPPGLYEGETALHIAIVNHDLDFVKLLINSGAYVRARAYGGFFNIKGPCYYGEYPLSFAASTGQTNIVQYLTRHGARPDLDADLLGNTALHMCVYHTQPDMYNLLLELGALEQLENNDGMSCTLLAARLGNATMFQYICDRNRQISWQYGPVTSYILAMREIDTVQSVKANPKLRQSALATIVHEKHRHMLDMPLPNTLFRIKWAAFGYRAFLLDLALHCCSVGLLLAIAIVRSHGAPSRHSSFGAVAHTVLQFLLLAVVLLHIGYALNDCYYVVRHTLNIERIRHATMSYVPPTYPIPNSEPAQAVAPVEEEAIGVGETRERVSQDVRTFMSMHSSSDGGGSLHRTAASARPVGTTWREGGAYQELTSAAASKEQTRRMLRPSWVPAAGAPGPAPPPDAGHAAAVCVPITDARGRGVAEGADAGNSLREFADEVWHSVIQADAGAPRTASLFDNGDYEPDGLWGRQASHARAGTGASPGLGISAAPNLFEELINEPYDGDLLNPNQLDKSEPQGGNVPARPVAVAKPAKPAHVQNMLPSPMRPKAMLLAVACYAWKAVRRADDLPQALLIVYYAFALLEALVWIGLAGHKGTGQSRQQLLAVDALLAAALFTGLSGVGLYFARGWRTPGALVVAMTMALDRLCKIVLPIAAVVLAFAFAIATLVQGSANGVAIRAAYPGASFFGVVWSCWRLFRTENGSNTSDAALYAVLGRTDGLTPDWNAALVWVLYLLLQASALVVAAMAVAVTVSIMRDSFATAVECWKLKWCSYIIKLEYRLPEYYRQKYRIGDKGVSTQWRRQVYIYQYEEIDHDTSSPASRANAQGGAASTQAL